MASKKAPKPSKEQNALAKAQTAATYDQMALTKDYYAWAMKQADIEGQRGAEELAFQRDLADKALVRSDEQWAYEKQATDEAMARSRKYDDRYWNTTAKQEDAFYGLVDKYDSNAEGARMAGRGITDVETQLDNARGAQIRGLTSRGWNPNSAAMQSSMGDMELEGALAKASASTMAYEAAKREGLNLRATAAGLGGNLMGAGAGYLGQANGGDGGGYLGASSGFSGTGLNAGGTGFRAGNTAWGGQNAGQNTAMGWGSSANNTWNSIAEQNYRRSQSGGMGGLGAVVGGLAGSFLGPMGSKAGSAAGTALFGK